MDPIALTHLIFPPEDDIREKVQWSIGMTENFPFNSREEFHIFMRKRISQLLIVELFFVFKTPSEIFKARKYIIKIPNINSFSLS